MSKAMEKGVEKIARILCEENMLEGLDWEAVGEGSKSLYREQAALLFCVTYTCEGKHYHIGVIQDDAELPDKEDVFTEHIYGEVTFSEAIMKAMLKTGFRKVIEE